jgi:hypothetical protein
MQGHAYFTDDRISKANVPELFLNKTTKHKKIFHYYNL